MRERGLQPDFSRAALAQTQAIPGAAQASGETMPDLRDLPWASIDNDDSRDLDQLSVARPAGGGAMRILVAVADVDAIVQRHTPIDEHAQANTTSVYTIPQIFPMLPERLSTDLTSLREGEARLAVVVEMAVSADGTVTRSEIYRASVRNHAKLAYNSVAAWLDGNAPPPPRLAEVPELDQQLRTQDSVAQAMKRLRQRRGALTLDTIEPRGVLDDGVLVDLVPDEKNRARELIEDFMIAANGATAKFLERNGYPSLRRVLRSPKRWERIVMLAASMGEQLPPEPDAVALEQFLVRRRQAEPERFCDVSLSVIKLLGRGEYAVELPGHRPQEHFGLAVRDYTHSTAPNRRFPDLITQRLVKAALAGERPPYDQGQLAELAAHCTLQEDNADKVERQVYKSAAALLLASRIGERFDAIVTGAAAKGTWARIARPIVEGRVVRGFEDIDVGDHVRVQLLRVDVERGFIDFARVQA